MRDHDSIVLTKLQDKKNRGYILAASLNRLGYDTWAPLVQDCGTYIGMATDERGVGHIVEANFCTHRLCPTCNWRRSLRIYATTSRILDYLDQTEGKRIKYLFLTLTVRSVPLTELGSEIDKMSSAFRRLISNRAWTNRVLGCMRTLEITINKDTGMAHPHYHLILAVPRSYATKGDKLYWSYEQWQAVWRKSAKLNYDPQISIERIKGGREAGIAETAKYMAKDTDYLIDATQANMGTEEAEALTDWLVENLVTQMKGRRLVGYTGLLRKAQQALKITNPETGELTDTIRGDVAQAIRHYHWNAGLCCYVSHRK